MADVTAQRAALAETRARIDAHLDELTEHVPDRERLRTTAMKYAGAAAGAFIGIVGLAIVTKSTLAGRRTRKEATSYATAVARAMPDVMRAWNANADTGVADVPASPRPRPTPPKVATPTKATTSLDGGVVNPPRGGVGSALLMAAGVVGGVAVAQSLNRGGEVQDR